MDFRSFESTALWLDKQPIIGGPSAKTVRSIGGIVSSRYLGHLRSAEYERATADAMEGVDIGIIDRYPAAALSGTLLVEHTIKCDFDQRRSR